MKKLKYLKGTECAAASDEDIENFRRRTGIADPAQDFLDYCKNDNGGVPASENEYFKPSLLCHDYWEFCGNRVINSAGEIDVGKLLGLHDEGRFSIYKWTNNARTVWHLSDEYFVVAYDGIGSTIVSKLLAGDSRVFFWEPHVEPHFFMIAERLAEFYSNLVPSDQV